MIVGMLLIGMIGILMDRVLSFIAKKVMPWVETRRA